MIDIIIDGEAAECLTESLNGVGPGKKSRVCSVVHNHV